MKTSCNFQINVCKPEIKSTDNQTSSFIQLLGPKTHTIELCPIVSKCADHNQSECQNLRVLMSVRFLKAHVCHLFPIIMNEPRLIMQTNYRGTASKAPTGPKNKVSKLPLVAVQTGNPGCSHTVWTITVTRHIHQHSLIIPGS